MKRHSLNRVVAVTLGLTAVLLPAAVVLAYAAGFFALALWRFKFE
jgi:hypothetical protein